MDAEKDDTDCVSMISNYLNACSKIIIRGGEEDFDLNFKPDMVIINLTGHLNPQSRILDRMISGLILSMGVPVNLRGFGYLREAVILAVEDDEILKEMTGKLYPSVALIFDVSPGSVERGMRHAICRAWNECTDETAQKRIRAKFKRLRKSPSNSVFIRLISGEVTVAIRG